MPNLKNKDYNSGYGQALADVLQVLSEIALRAAAAEDPSDIRARSALDPAVVLARGQGIRLGVSWVRSAVKGLKGKNK